MQQHLDCQLLTFQTHPPPQLWPFHKSSSIFNILCNSVLHSHGETTSPISWKCIKSPMASKHPRHGFVVVVASILTEILQPKLPLIFLCSTLTTTTTTTIACTNQMCLSIREFDMSFRPVFFFFFFFFWHPNQTFEAKTFIGQTYLLQYDILRN